jgi:hypothetical protein
LFSFDKIDFEKMVLKFLQHREELLPLSTHPSNSFFHPLSVEFFFKWALVAGDRIGSGAHIEEFKNGKIIPKTII